MPVQANVNISFAAEDPAAVEAAVAALNAPEGSYVSASMSQTVVAGIVEDGAVKEPEPPA
jgi:hypothetical protein